MVGTGADMVGVTESERGIYVPSPKRKTETRFARLFIKRLRLTVIATEVAKIY